MPSSSGNGRDSDLALVLAVLILAAIAASLIQGLRLPSPHGSPIALLGAALGAVTIPSALVRQRLVATRRALAARCELALVPADEFAADPESVLRFASQLLRTEPVVRGWLERPAAAIRVRLGHDADGLLTYSLGVPGRSRAVLEEALRGYRGIEVIEVEPAARERSADEVARVELVLARPSVEPLGTLSLKPDPLGAFAAALDREPIERGAESQVCIDLMPASGTRQRHLRRVLRRQARRLHRERPDLATILGGGRPPSAGREPVENVERRAVSGALDTKLRDGGPLFEAQILLRGAGETEPQAKAAVDRLLAAFAPTASARNWLRASGLRLPGLAFLGSDLPHRRRSFDRRLASGRFRPARRSIVTTREMLGFLKPPSEDCVAENILRCGPLLPKPPALPDFDPKKSELIPLGEIRDDRGARVAGVRAADSIFTYIAGRSRFGKTELAISQFVHLVRAGHGGLFLDPHGDALDRIRPYLTEPEVARRVVEIDVGPGTAGRPQPGWNLFELRGAELGESEARVEGVVDAFASALGWGERSTRAINLTTQAAGALATIARVLDPEIAPTIFQIPTLLTDEEWREAVLPFLPKSARSFWIGRFGRLSEEAVTPVTNMIDRLRASTAAATLLGQSQGSYRSRDAMDRSSIVLFCPGSGGARDRLLANLLVFDLFNSAVARGEVAAGSRRPFFVCLDEVQTFDGGQTKLPALIEETAKFGLRGIFMNQNPARLSGATLNALTTNRSHLLTSNLNSSGAGLMENEFGKEPKAESISRLPKYRFVAQVTDGGVVSAPFLVRGVRVEEALGEEGQADRLDFLRRESSKATARATPADAIRHLESLDDRILAALRQAGPTPTESASVGPYQSGTKIGEEL